jgi:hypothetical protein
MQPHFPADVQHLMPRQAFVQEFATQLPPDDPPVPPDPLEELGALIDAHDPPWQVWPACAQSLQAVPPVPHSASLVPCWHMSFTSQQPAHDAVQPPPPTVMPPEPLVPLLLEALLLPGVLLMLAGGVL